jgi:ribonuclease-3
MPRRRKKTPVPPDLGELEARLGHRFADRALLEKALTHRSAPTVAAGGPDNERLEFLGDAVLELAVSELLYRKACARDEGGLTQVRALLVNQAPLARIAWRLGVPEFLRLGRGERDNGGAKRPSLNSNALEALLGAVYIDAGYETALQVVKNLFRHRIRHALDRAHAKDPKSLLQELSLARYNALPRYVMVKETGREHDRRFQVKVVLKNQLESTGAGKSKKAAERLAAAAALKKLNGSPSS